MWLNSIIEKAKLTVNNCTCCSFWVTGFPS